MPTQNESNNESDLKRSAHPITERKRLSKLLASVIITKEAGVEPSFLIACLINLISDGQTHRRDLQNIFDLLKEGQPKIRKMPSSRKNLLVFKRRFRLIHAMTFELTLKTSSSRFSIRINQQIGPIKKISRWSTARRLRKI